MAKETPILLSNNPTLQQQRPGETPKPPSRRTMEFHISQKARKKYQFEESLFSLTGNVILANFHSSRLLAQQMNDQKDLLRFPEEAVKAGHINAMGLIDEILHYVIDLYRQQIDPGITAEALTHLEEHLGKKEVDKMLLEFTKEFPPAPVYRKAMKPQAYLEGQTDGTSHREMALEEILMLWLANRNPAFSPFKELFDDSRLEQQTAYAQAAESMRGFFQKKPFFGPEKQNLIEMLRTPAVLYPDSLTSQLTYMRSSWGILLGKYLLRLLQSLDYVKEEEKMFFGGGPGPSQVLEYEGTDYEEEPENFSPDTEWMPKVVMLAKSSLVWLDQLSRQHQREIRQLDQIPDEELDRLADQGFNALWLIGLWERSQASQRIKKMCGNPEAEASAYSLKDYDIAPALGGWEALHSLKSRCLRRGIQLASDMVPNHTGIDSNWVINHPDRFLSLDHQPFPTYTFNGENLSQDDRVGIYLEDHYYEKTDAAVVFKRVDHHTGTEKYIYHGNDGTHMPWNDTAQIDFLNPEAREAVIQKILHVARNFPIIRFDAAMTLAKKHIQRLWYPEPGSGGDIASRAEFGLTKQDFDRAIPQEFWREVVDRVAQEVPDTLLLAEAFWMMEGYFVRTLGMHRVYNSAFMNMMKKEENEKYRYTIKNTQEFDPEILKRFVNFMNNPDEETAVAQFGKGDKYFGVATMMITMPGLPMFGHGQIEGYAEKYGMEYSRAYWDEKPDQELIRRHGAQIFPLMKRRHLFAGVENFLLYDLWTPEGQVNENVFAFSNGTESERAVVFYNNAYEQAQGWIKTSAAFARKDQNGEKTLVQKSLAEGLGLTNAADAFVLLKNQGSGQWVIRSSKEIHESGMYLELKGYETQVYLDVEEVRDNELGHYAALHHELNGASVPSIDEALKMRLLAPLYQSLERVFQPSLYKDMAAYAQGKPLSKGMKPAEYFAALEESLLSSFSEAAAFIQEDGGSPEKAAKAVCKDLEVLPDFINLASTFSASRTKGLKEGIQEISKEIPGSSEELVCLFTTWSLFRNLGLLLSEKEPALYSRSCLDEWLLLPRFRELFRGTELSRQGNLPFERLLKMMVRHQNWAAPSKNKQVRKKDFPLSSIKELLIDQEFRREIGENRYNNILWFNKELFEDRFFWLLLTGIYQLLAGEKSSRSRNTAIVELLDTYKTVLKAERASGYRIDQFLKKLGAAPDSKTKTDSKTKNENTAKPRKGKGTGK